ncbi:MAG TPA: cyclic pyranopterin monophosphate synthase MoaC [Hyphomonadaceae bacterium]|nr:cyclic pyranopterin monophosphate synthase MoaC [Hyphomonadaceae bacterium]
MSGPLTHFDDEGRPAMVDVSAKPETARAATARGRVVFTPDAYQAIRRQGVKKGDILRVAELAGVIGAKKTPDLIPLCHPLMLTSVKVSASFDDDASAIEIVATVTTKGQTGVEMEALTAASVACLTVYDMAKAVDKSMSIGPIVLVEKSGGRSGDYQRRRDDQRR